MLLGRQQVTLPLKQLQIHMEAITTESDSHCKVDRVYRKKYLMKRREKKTFKH